MLRPVRVVAFVLASRLASQDLSGEGKTGTERESHKSEITALLLLSTAMENYRGDIVQ